MSALEITLRLGAGLLLVAANAFFVVTEFALTRLRQLDPAEFRDDPRLRRAWAMTERLEIYLTGCQLGITASSILLGVVTEPAVSRLLRPPLTLLGASEHTVSVTAVALAVVAINLVHKIWGEQAPTYLGVERPREVARWTATAHHWWTRVMYPVIYFGDGAAKATLRLFGVEIRRSWTEDETAAEEGPGEPITSLTELRGRLARVLERGTLPKDRRREILAALEIEEIPITEIMVPREEILALETGAPVEEGFSVLAEHGKARYPLVGEDLDDFRGIVYVPAVFRHLEELLAGSTSFEAIAAPPMRVASDETVSTLIDRFQEAGQELALVEDGTRIVGLVTATDAFEAIAGELEDPYD